MDWFLYDKDLRHEELSNIPNGMFDRGLNSEATKNKQKKQQQQ